MVLHTTLIERDPTELRPYEMNARVHSKKQIMQIATSISRFGFNVPVLIDDEDRIIAGHGRIQAALHLGLTSVPTILIDHLNDVERRAFTIADNKIALNANWDLGKLSAELVNLTDLDIDLSSIGFEMAEADFIIDQAQTSSRASTDDTWANAIPPVPVAAVARAGDLFQLGRHFLLCGDARELPHVKQLMQGRRADLVFTDPPYNVRIEGHVSGLGKHKHREFAMGSGELSAVEFSSFLAASLAAAGSVCRDGAIVFVCMDWRGALPLLIAGSSVFGDPKQLCVWNKTNGGMGTFYRSKHELIFVFKKGLAPHTNTFGLGDTGRYRTNVWDYPGMSSVGSKRDDELARHPTAPMGYDGEKGRLKVNKVDAARVIKIFEIYRTLKNGRLVLAELQRQGIRTRAGHLFTRGALFYLLKNRAYIGEIRHHQEWFTGAHDGIVPPELFDAVQVIISTNAVNDNQAKSHKDLSWLSGRVYDAYGIRMRSDMTSKGGRIYRYYVGSA